jgi:hypothetical protein
MNRNPANREEAALPVVGGWPAQSPSRRYRPRKSPSEGKSIAPSSRISGYYAWFFLIGVFTLILYYCLFNPNQRPVEILCLSSFVFGVGSLPMAWFLRNGRTYQIPVLGVHCLFLAVCFGFSGFLAVPSVSANKSVEDEDIARALACASLGLTCLLAGYSLAGRWLRNRVRPWSPGWQIRSGNLELLGWMSVAAGYAGAIVTKLGVVSFSQITGIFSTLGFFLLLTLALEKRMSILARIVVLLLLVPFVLLHDTGFRTGQLAGIVTTLCWISLIFLRTHGRVSWPLILAAVVFFLVFQPVKFYVRAASWGEGRDLSLRETITAYADGFRQYYGTSKEMLAGASDSFGGSFTRINHLIVTAAIIRDTPSPIPFLYGRSYLPLLTKPIPRFLWPGKPQERFGNYWAQRYGFVGENDSTTSFNLPWLPEMFMNFGWSGVIIIMFLVGVVYRYLWLKFMSQPGSVVQYVLGLVIASMIIFTESNLSMKLGGVIILFLFVWVLGQLLQFVGFENVRVHRKRDSTRTTMAGRPGDE